MVKVWKSVGAIRIYSFAAAGAIAAAFVIVLVGFGFLAGWLANDGSGVPKAGAATPVAAAQPAAPAPAKAAAAAPKPARAAPSGTYRQGYRAGLGASLAAPGVFVPGGAYVVKFDGSGSGLTVAQHVPLQPGNDYWLCSGGTRICYQQVTH